MFTFVFSICPFSCNAMPIINDGDGPQKRTIRAGVQTWKDGGGTYFEYNHKAAKALIKSARSSANFFKEGGILAGILALGIPVLRVATVLATLGNQDRSTFADLLEEKLSKNGFVIQVVGNKATVYSN